jgi:hypothetical protein
VSSSTSRFKFRRALHSILKQAREPHFEKLSTKLQQSLITSAAGIAVKILIMHNNVRKRRILRALLEQDSKTAFVRYSILVLLLLLLSLLLLLLLKLN